MAFSSTQSRPFANQVSTSPTDVDRNPTNAITTSLGNGAWGINTASIWGNGTNGNGFGRAGVKDKLKSDFSGNRGIDTGVKHGSGSLLESSESDSWPPNQSLGDSTMRLSTHNVQNGHAEHPRSLSKESSISPTTTRTPAVNLTNSSFPHTRSSFASAPVFGFFSNDRPNVYPKLKDQSYATDSAISPSSGSISPINERKAQWHTQYQTSTSREVSRPPQSAHSDRQFPVTMLDLPTQSERLTRSRPGYLTSQRHGSLGNVNPDYIPTTFSPANSRPQSARSAQLPFHNNAQHGAYHDTYDDTDFGRHTSLNNQTSSSPYANGQYNSNTIPFEASEPRSNGLQYHDFKPKHDEYNNLIRSPWQDAVNPGNEVGRRVNNLADQQLVQAMQFMALKLPNNMYNPYNLPAQMPMAMQPYLNYFPLGMPGSTNPQQPDIQEEGVQSAKLFDFKNNGRSNRRYELKDIYDHIAEFAGDQHGSRFIQTKLETANSDEKERVFKEIEPNAIPLMTDVFGNYVIQKFFDHGHQEHKKVLANKMRGQVLNLSLQMYGCRVVQKALEHVLLEQQAALVSELENHVLKCVKDQNGNHVVQKAIERCPAESISFIYQSFVGQVHSLSLHPYGCRVIQRCLERQEWFPAKPTILAELHDSMPKGMIPDPYGNYVVQHVVQNGPEPDRQHILAIVLEDVVNFSRHKFASNVVEVCVTHSDDVWRRRVVEILTTTDHIRAESETVLNSLIKDNYGNYVIQKLLDCLSPEDFVQFHQHLQPAMSHTKRTGSGKQVASIEKKMQRFEYLRYPQHGTSFTSNLNSLANTPPPLTADTQSLQSSTMPSINGDAVEGATSMSRKGSEAPDNVLPR